MNCAILNRVRYQQNRSARVSDLAETADRRSPIAVLLAVLGVAVKTWLLDIAVQIDHRHPDHLGPHELRPRTSSSPAHRGGGPNARADYRLGVPLPSMSPAAADIAAPWYPTPSKTAAETNSREVGGWG